MCFKSKHFNIEVLDVSIIEQIKKQAQHASLLGASQHNSTRFTWCIHLNSAVHVEIFFSHSCARYICPKQGFRSKHRHVLAKPLWIPRLSFDCALTQPIIACYYGTCANRRFLAQMPILSTLHDVSLSESQLFHRNLWCCCEVLLSFLRNGIGSSISN